MSWLGLTEEPAVDFLFWSNKPVMAESREFGMLMVANKFSHRV